VAITDQDLTPVANVQRSRQRDGLPARAQSRWSGLWQRAGPWPGLLVSGALIVTCYGFALGLPFYFDDLPVFSWLSDRSLIELWTGGSDNGYYRPLTFTVYMLGRLFPMGTQQVVLHGTNVLLHWLNAVLVMLVARRIGDGERAPLAGTLAGALYAVFPFLYRAVPWVTAMPHMLVVTLTLLAAYAALRAESEGRTGWWLVSVLATALAPFAHESGLTCGIIVGGVIWIRHDIWHRRRIAWVALGGLLNLGALLLRMQLPGIGSFKIDGLSSWFENVMFFLHGLVYPVGTAIGWLVHQRGWHDFTLIILATLGLAAVLVVLAVRTRRWRWIAIALWWWLWGSLPAALRFGYLGLINSPRFYALGGVGIVILWGYAIASLSQLVRRRWGQVLTWSLCTAAIVVPNLAYLSAEQGLHRQLFGVYQQILVAAKEGGSEPLGCVNLPAWLAPRRQAYALSKDGVIALPLYTNAREFLGINGAAIRADNVMFVHTLYNPEPYSFGYHGDWPDWDQMRQFALQHRSVWQVRYQGGRFVALPVGSMLASDASPGEQVARFEGGPVLESAYVRAAEQGHWELALDWLAAGPVDAQVFVHIVDRNGVLALQADGAALGGMVPMGIWQAGDRIHDVRHLYLPEQGGPYTVLVGVFDGSGRFPALVDGVRVADDAVPVATIEDK
jgi:hypothetical protein